MATDNLASVPVALFAYARPWHLLRILDGLKKNRVPIIFAFSDGPRTPDKEALVQEVRQILLSVNWCELHIVKGEKNLGLGPSIRSGVTDVLQDYDRVIVVEDDIVLRPGAYDYTVAALKQYENIAEVMTISMWSYPTLVPKGAVNGFFSKRFVCWGWGTYRSAWSKYLGTPLELYVQCVKKQIPVLDWGIDIRYQAEIAAQKKLWYVGYALTHFLYQGISYFPSESLTANIGFDGSGENTGARRKENHLLIEKPVCIPQTWPDVSVIPGLEKKFAAYFKPKKPTLIHRFRNYLGMQRRRLIKHFQR